MRREAICYSAASPGQPKNTSDNRRPGLSCPKIFGENIIIRQSLVLAGPQRERCETNGPKSQPVTLLESELEAFCGNGQE